MRWRILLDKQGYRLQRSRLGIFWVNVHWDGNDYHFETASHAGHDIKPTWKEAKEALDAILDGRKAKAAKKAIKPKIVFSTESED